MLVLTRKNEESIIISLNGQNITVKVLKVEGNKVRLGVTAPEQVIVHREEVWQRQAQFAADKPVLLSNRL